MLHQGQTVEREETKTLLPWPTALSNLLVQNLPTEALTQDREAALQAETLQAAGKGNNLPIISTHKPVNWMVDHLQYLKELLLV